MKTIPFVWRVNSIARVSKERMESKKYFGNNLRKLKGFTSAFHKVFSKTNVMHLLLTTLT